MSKLWKICRCYDPALEFRVDDSMDGPCTDAAEYAQTRDEESLVKRDGREPVWFFLRPMTTESKRGYVELAREEKDHAERYRRAFEVCIDHIEFPDQPTYRAERGSDGRLRAGELDRLREKYGLGDMCFRDIGAAAYWRAEVPLDVPGGLRPPVSSALGLQALAQDYRRAARATQSSRNNGTPKAQPTTTSSAPGESVSAAIVSEKTTQGT